MEWLWISDESSDNFMLPMKTWTRFLRRKKYFVSLFFHQFTISNIQFPSIYFEIMIFFILSRDAFIIRLDRLHVILFRLRVCLRFRLRSEKGKRERKRVQWLFLRILAPSLHLKFNVKKTQRHPPHLLEKRIVEKLTLN